jgi:hypothetical protein
VGSRAKSVAPPPGFVCHAQAQLQSWLRSTLLNSRRGGNAMRLPGRFYYQCTRRINNCTAVINTHMAITEVTEEAGAHEGQGGKGGKRKHEAPQ